MPFIGPHLSTRVGPACLIWVLVWRIVCQSNCRFARFHVTVDSRDVYWLVKGTGVYRYWYSEGLRKNPVQSFERCQSKCLDMTYGTFVDPETILDLWLQWAAWCVFEPTDELRVADKSRLLSSLHFVITSFLLRIVVLRSANSRLVLFVPLWLLISCPPHPDAWMWFSSCRNAVTIVTTSQHTVPQWNRFFNR